MPSRETGDRNFCATEIAEKPVHPLSNWAITGLYVYDNKVVRYADNIAPSERGELGITDVNKLYLASGELYVERMGRDFAWLDTGTFESLLDAGTFVQTIERRQGMRISSPEEIAFRMQFISASELRSLGIELQRSGYGEYLLRIAEE